MAIVRWNPLNIPSLLDDDWDLPTLSSSKFGSGINVYETDNSVIAEVALPGISDEKIDISIDKGIVRISASDEQKQEDKNKRKYFMSSIAKSYNYSFRLPDGIVSDQEPEATLNNGILKLSFNKAQPIAPKKIKVISGSNSTQMNQKS